MFELNKWNGMESRDGSEINTQLMHSATSQHNTYMYMSRALICT